MDSSQRRDSGSTLRPSDGAMAVHRSSGSFELVLGAALFALLGLLIDTWVGTTPLFTIVLAIGAFVGAAASIYYRYIAAMEVQDAARTERLRPRAGTAEVVEA